MLAVSDYIFSFLFLFIRLQSRNPRSDEICIHQTIFGNTVLGFELRIYSLSQDLTVSYFGNCLYGNVGGVYRLTIH